MKRPRNPFTTQLSQAPYEPAVKHDHRWLAVGVLVGVAAVVAVVSLGDMLVHASREPVVKTTELEAENSRLSKELEESRLQYEVERATRSQLEEQLAGVTKQLKQVNDELQFVKRGHGRR